MRSLSSITVENNNTGSLYRIYSLSFRPNVKIDFKALRWHTSECQGHCMLSPIKQQLCTGCS